MGNAGLFMGMVNMFAGEGFGAQKVDPERYYKPTRGKANKAKKARRKTAKASRRRNRA